MSYNENIHEENVEDNDQLNGVAIIGMAGRFPEAKNIEEYWQNLENGKDGITFYTDQDLIDAGVEQEILKNPDYIKAKAGVTDIDLFDASFFGINPREAEVTDPQHRMLLECAWEALEHAGYDSSKYNGPIGIFAGKSMDYYLLLNVYPRIRKEISAGSLQAAIGNDKDSLTTTISYRLNLTGPAISVQTSSSTSLVSVCVASQSLLTYQCDIALAGGITAGPPVKSGYLYQEGNIWAPDGHCRAYDAKANGFVPGSGMGLVVLKRLEDAIDDCDTIWAVIKGFAVNNDGSKKVSYSAPSVDAQAEVVAEALAVADVHPETIQYIEGHGTATNLGDPIEISALTQAFQSQTDKKQFCAIGSVKTNIGHLDNAAGIAGLLKVALSLKHKKIPPTLHFETPNPKLNIENSPFFVNTKLREWEPNFDRKGRPIYRRAGVTSLGMGGTNAHVILEEAPLVEYSTQSRKWQLLFLSAKSSDALNAQTFQLLEYLKFHEFDNPNLYLADTAYTLIRGRRDFNFRRMVLCQDYEEAKTTLEKQTPGLVFDSVCNVLERPVVFMFSGQGAQYVNMAKELYQNENLFKANIDKCSEILTPILGMDPRHVIYPEKDEDNEKNAEFLKQTWLTQPVLFILEYSLAQLWIDWGIEPAAMIGHSIGEFAAACIAGCMSLEDALELVAIRGRLMHQQEHGTMLSVEISESELEGILNENISLAAVNSPKHCVVSGKTEAVKKLEEELTAKNIFCKSLRTSHAFHSAMMEPILQEFAETIAKKELNPPNIPFISGVTGTWIKENEVSDPQYWARQLRQPVRFSKGLNEILKDPSRLLLEVGPGNSLCLLANAHKIEVNGNDVSPTTFSSIRHIKQSESDIAFLLKTLGNLWLSGVIIDWKSYYKHEKRRRINLPTYPFERKRYWLDEYKDKEQGKEIMDTRKEKVNDTSETTSADTVTRPIETEKRTFQPRPQLSSEYVAPTDEIEQNIVDIWEDILGIKPIGIQDNYFDLGGHSLLVTLFLSRLQEKFKVRLEMRTVFEEPTIDSIAQLVRTEIEKFNKKQDRENSSDEIEQDNKDIYSTLEPSKKEQNYFLSSAQKRFYMLRHIDPTGNSYNMTGIMHLHGELKKQQTENAVQRLLKRHDSLRTSFLVKEGEAVQYINSDVKFNIEYHKIESKNEEDIEKIIKKFIRPFDLTQPPLLRLGLIWLEEKEHILMFDMHHIISDRASMNLLIRDFTAFYSNKELPTLKIQYKDFCEWQNQSLISGKLEKQEQYWLDHFSGELPVLNMPTDYPRPKYQNFDGDAIHFSFDQEFTNELNMLIKETRTTLFMMLLAIYNIVLSKYTGQEDIIIGLPISVRNNTHLENVIGLLIETLAIRNFPEGEKPFNQFLEEVRQNTLNAFENQAYPFRELVKKVADENDFSRSPLFDAMLIVQSQEINLEEINIGDSKLVPYQRKKQLQAQVDMTIESEEKENKIHLHLKYCTKLFKKETIERFITIFKEVAFSVVRNKEIKLKDIKVSLDLVNAYSNLYKDGESEFTF